MIPKTIHYCWFGKGEYSEKIKYCMSTWDKKLVGYTIQIWNEDNFDLDICPFVKEAYSQKKYAFVSDYVRLYVLSKYGGIYLDTDIEVLKPFDDILHKNVILGTDDCGSLTAFMAAEPDHCFFNEMLDIYNNMKFIKENGTFNTTVNNIWLQDVLGKYGYQVSNRMQNLQGGICVYPDEYFHAKSLVDGKENVTDRTYCIHHHTLLWVTKYTR
ncbi:MAG: glycosyl transferase, partial [Clostridia bacterium]|nr:glycosyl transferase [Clostridia bacterium]